MPKNVDEMLEAVNEAFNELEPKTLDNVWLTLQYVMNEILKAKGSNDFDLPHHNKQKMEAEGLLERQVKAPVWAVKECWDIMDAYCEGPATNTEEEPEEENMDEMDTEDHLITDNMHEFCSQHQGIEDSICILQSEQQAIKASTSREGTNKCFQKQPVTIPFGEGTSKHNN